MLHRLSYCRFVHCHAYIRPSKHSSSPRPARRSRRYTLIPTNSGVFSDNDHTQPSDIRRWQSMHQSNHTTKRHPASSLVSSALTSLPPAIIVLVSGTLNSAQPFNDVFTSLFRTYQVRLYLLVAHTAADKRVHERTTTTRNLDSLQVSATEGRQHHTSRRPCIHRR